jgi:hypothetical protein
MTANLHTRRAALGLLGATALAAPALGQSVPCQTGYISACAIDDIAWVDGQVVWPGCIDCPDAPGGVRNQIMRARPGEAPIAFASADSLLLRPFDDKLYAIDWTRGPRRSLIFSLPELELIADLDDGGKAIQTEPSILRETRAVLSESVSNINRMVVNFRYGIALRKDNQGGDEVWWMATGRPDTLRRIARLDWSIRGYLDNDFQHFDGSTVIFPNYSDLVNGRGPGEHDVPTLTVFPDGRTETGLIPFAIPLYSVGFTIQRATSGFVIGIGDTFGEFSGIYRVEGGIWSQFYAGSVNRMSFPMEPGGTRLAWSSRENLPPDQRNRNGLGNRKHELHVSEI